MVKHTLILVQFNPNKSSRQYHDFNSVSNAMDGICKMFEQKLRQQQPNARNITYDIQDLYAYVDSLSDLAALVFDASVQAYVPRGKEWIKQRVFKHLKKIAEFGSSGATINGGDSMQQ